jgi:hypothetical protein
MTLATESKKLVSVVLLTACTAVAGVFWIVRHPDKPQTLTPAQTQIAPAQVEAEQAKVPPSVPMPPANKHQQFDTALSQQYEEDRVYSFCLFLMCSQIEDRFARRILFADARLLTILIL